MHWLSRPGPNKTDIITEHATDEGRKRGRIDYWQVTLGIRHRPSSWTRYAPLPSILVMRSHGTPSWIRQQTSSSNKLRTCKAEVRDQRDYGVRRELPYDRAGDRAQTP
jgi:hypothetical protein